MKNILVTGAGGGMGRAVCAALAKAGYSVWGLDIVTPETTDGWRFIKTDLTDAAAVTAAFETVSTEAEKLDAIVHLAGMYDLNSLVEMPEDEFIRIFDVNLFSVYRVNRQFLPILGKGGRIVITSSELAPLDPLPFTGIYAITKAAIEKYAYSLRMELQLLGYSVSVLRPGAVKTGLLSVSTRRLDDFCDNTELYRCNAERFRKIVNDVEARNVPPEKIAKAVLCALKAKRPRYVYNVNRNGLLRLLNILPQHMQTAVIGRILKTEE